MILFLLCAYSLGAFLLGLGLGLHWGERVGWRRDNQPRSPRGTFEKAKDHV